MEKPVNITFNINKGYLWIILPKAVNNNNYLQIRNRIESRIQSKADKVIIDLSHVSRMDSLLIGLLLHMRKLVKNKRGFLYLVNASKKCSTKLHSLFLDKIFTICDNEKQIFAENS
jgi:anti-anti-sigma factor